MHIWINKLNIIKQSKWWADKLFTFKWVHGKQINAVCYTVLKDCCFDMIKCSKFWTVPHLFTQHNVESFWKRSVLLWYGFPRLSTHDNSILLPFVNKNTKRYMFQLIWDFLRVNEIRCDTFWILAQNQPFATLWAVMYRYVVTLSSWSLSSLYCHDWN